MTDEPFEHVTLESKRGGKRPMGNDAEPLPTKINSHKKVVHRGRSTRKGGIRGGHSTNGHIQFRSCIKR